MIDMIKGNYFKVNFDLLLDDEITWQEACFLGYLTNIYPILEVSIKGNDGKTYRRLSDLFITDKLDMSSPTIRKYLEDLELSGYINIEHKTHEKRSSRFYRLSDEYLEKHVIPSLDKCMSKESKDERNMLCKVYDIDC